MKNQYLIATIVLGVSAIAALTVYLLNLKKEQKPKWVKPGVTVFTALFLASTVFLSIGAATNQLEKPEDPPAFDPSLNGYLENVETPDGLYTGEFLAGQYHGSGTLFYNDGSVYDGTWNTGKREGQGEYVSVEGWAYKGAWLADTMHGRGLYTFKDKSTYEGNFKDGLKSGQGKRTFANGETYDGNWDNDEINGRGAYTYTDGSVYDGNWANGKWNGQAIYTSALG
jgi:hypothetical protein